MLSWFFRIHKFESSPYNLLNECSLVFKFCRELTAGFVVYGTILSLTHATCGAAAVNT